MRASDSSPGRWGRPIAVAVIGALLAGTVAVVGAAPAGAVPARQFVRSWGNPPLGPGDFAAPHGVAVDASGQVYVIDTTQGWVQVFTATGTLVRGWPASGGTRIALSPTTGNVFVSSESLCRVTEYTPLGATVRSYGTCGPANGQFDRPASLAVAPDGSVYVADYVNDRVQRFDATGGFVRSWPVDNAYAIAIGPGGVVHVGNYQRTATYTADGLLLRTLTPGTDIPIGIATGPDGATYVTDSYANRVMKYSAAGTLVAQWGGGGEGSSAPGSIDTPGGVAVAPSGDVYVVDQGNRRVQRFTDAGAYVAEFGTYTRDGRLRAPAGVATDAAGNVYVADQKNNQVQVFDGEGTFLRKWRDAGPGQRLDAPTGIDVAANGDVFVANSGADRVERYTSGGQWLGSIGQGQFSWPTWLSVASNGHLYVTDTAANRVRELDGNGALVRSFDPRGGTGDSTIYTPWAITTGPDGSVYVVDKGLSRVRQFTATGTFVRGWGSAGTGPGQFTEANGIALDPTGDLYVTDCGADRVQRFSPTGQYLDVVGGHGTGDGQFTCPVGIAFSGSDLYVADSNTGQGDSNDRIEQFAYPPSALLDVTLAVDEADVLVGDTVHFHVMIDNLGETTLTGVTSTASNAANCTRAVPDIAGLTTATFDCTYQPRPGDLPRFTTSVSIDTDQGPVVASNPVTVEVAHRIHLSQSREWSASTSSLPDTDPIAPAGPGNGGQGLATDPSGRVFVAGSRDFRLTARVARFAGNGVFDTQWGTAGQAAGQLWYPDSVAVAPDGDVFTTECTDLHRVQRFAADGTPEQAWTEPTGPGAGCSPADVAVAPDGTAYVADAANNRIDRITGNAYAPAWGSAGSGAGQFDGPRAVAVAPDGTVYVVDAGNRRVQRFSAAGAFLGEFGTSGTGNGQFVDPRDIAVTAAGWVLVADFGNASGGRRVQVFSPTGTFLGKVGVRTDDLAVHTDAGGNTHVYVYPFDGDDPSGVIREYVAPAGAYLTATLTTDRTQIGVGGTLEYQLAIENVGDVPLTGVTVDAGPLSGCGGATVDLAPGASTTRACTYRAQTGDIGRYYARVSVDADQTSPFLTANTGVEVLLRVVNHWGSDRLESANGVVANWSGDVYVTDCEGHRVLHYWSDGTFVRAWGAEGTGDGQFSCPTDITINRAGHLLVADATLRRVQEFTATGGFVRRWDTGTVQNYGRVTSLDTDDADNVYVADEDDGFVGPPCWYDQWGAYVCTQYPASPANNAVRRFSPTGTPVSQTSLTNAGGIAITSAGEMLVARGQGIQVRGAGGDVLGTITTPPNPTYPDDPGRVAVDRFGFIWATYPGVVRKFTPGGYELARWSIPRAFDIAFDRDNAYVTDGARGGITKLGAITAGEGTVAGTVTDATSGVPIPGAQVALLRAADYWFVGGATAAGDGTFEAEVPPGTYHLSVLDPARTHDPALYGAPTAVTVTNGGTAHADPALAPNRGAVAGTLTEDGTGDPVTGAWAIALSGTTAAPEIGTGSGAAGHYRLDGLRPGNHLMVFVDPAGGHVAEFHPNAPAASGAVPVPVTAGGTATADAALATQARDPGGALLTGRVRGRFNDGGFRYVGNVGVIALRASDFRFAAGTVTDADGRYELDVAPGTYKVVFIDGSGDHASSWHNGRSYDQLAQADPVTAPATVDASLARVTAEAVGTIDDERTGETLPGIWVLALDEHGVVASTTTDAGGAYQLRSLPPGDYRFLYIDPTGTHAAEYNNDTLYPTAPPLQGVVPGRFLYLSASLGP